MQWEPIAITSDIRRNRDALANRPVWLFSSGPLGAEAKDSQGRDKHAVTEPREIAEFRETIRPRDHRVFFGVLDPKKLGFTHRLVLKLPVNRDNSIFPVVTSATGRTLKLGPAASLRR